MGYTKEAQLIDNFMRELDPAERDERMWEEARVACKNAKPLDDLFKPYRPKLTQEEINNAPVWSDLNPDKEQY